MYDFPPLLKASLHNSGEHTRKQENATEKLQETAAQSKDLILSPWDYLKCIYFMISKWHYICPHKRNLKPARRLFYEHTSFSKTCSSFLYSTFLQCWREATLIQDEKELLNTSGCGFLLMHVRFLHLLLLLLCIRDYYFAFLLSLSENGIRELQGWKKQQREEWGTGDSREGTGTCTHGGKSKNTHEGLFTGVEK